MYLLIPLMLVVAVGLAWTWWSGRAGRDPVSSIDSFHRALDAMQPSLNPQARASDNDEEPARPLV